MSNMAKSNENLLQYPSNQQLCNSLNGPVAILWDIQNCSVPNGVPPEDVAYNVTRALQVHTTIRGPVTMFSAYGDFKDSTMQLRQACQKTGVKLVDVPKGRKDAADKAILLDMLLFACDNPIPSSIMLISGDVDFAPALHTLGRRGHTVILVIPPGGGVSRALSNAGKFVWDWPRIARGEGSVALRCHIKDNLDGQPEDSNVLRSELVKLLELSDGRLPLNRVQAEYQKHFGKPLRVGKLVNIFGKMGDTFAVEGTGRTKVVCLLNCKSGPSATPLNQAKNDEKGKGVEEENVDVTSGGSSGDT